MKPVSTANNLAAGITSGSPVVLYTCPKNTRAKFIMMYITNTLGSSKTISVDKNNGTSYPYLLNYSLTAGQYLHIHGGYVVLDPGESVRCTSTEAGSAFTIFCTFEEESYNTISN